MKFVLVFTASFFYTLFAVNGIGLPGKDSTYDHVSQAILKRPKKSEVLTFTPDKTLTTGSLNPNTEAKGSKQQSLKFDHRFVVYEYENFKNGTTNPKQIAVLKSMKAPRSSVGPLTEENLAAFYQISGKKIEISNTYIKSRRDIGLNLIAGNTFNGLSATTGRVEYYLSKTMGDMILPGKSGKGLTSLKIYFEGGQKKNNLNVDEITDQFTFTRGSIGIGKDYYPLRFMHWGPYAGYGMEFTRQTQSQNLLSTNFVELGARMGINLRHNFQLIGSVTWYHLINSVLLNEAGDVIEPSYDYKGTFPDRSGIGYSIAFRLML
ncbi:MAG TPA: hypothetical protein ENN90_00035 [Mariniphaga anaerophila]|uniref:Outer membrane protein beta-barrel domain-containing protein n=1 Tax=Mariniphaga anaerophila TaxID=1484053 RepID=A0A831PHU9_9BACT|nr:hypothetical protein [Mariniphaga anaerophila]